MSPARRLYFDNAATSFPKPPEVLRAMTDYAERLGASPGRGAYREAREAGEILDRCRRRLARLVGAESAEHVVFTLNTTDALNLAIRGVLDGAGPGAHAVTTAMDHNSVLRPLNELVERTGVRRTVVPADPATGLVDPEDVRRAVEPGTRLVAAVHASNVTGTLQPVAEIGRVCRDAGVPFLVDAAQTVGHIPIDVGAMNIDLLAFPGHKGLLGPLGTGGLVIRPGLERTLSTVREGGTGSASELPVQPRSLPDRYEPGSHNAIGIAGLDAALAWLEERTVESIAAHERELTRRFLDGLRDASGAPRAGLRLLGPATEADRVGVFAVVAEGLAPSALADRLERDHGVLTRPGLHCAPHAHETFGRSPADVGPGAEPGATRFSLGPFLTADDVDHATGALAALGAGSAGPAAAAAG